MMLTLALTLCALTVVGLWWVNRPPRGFVTCSKCGRWQRIPLTSEPGLVSFVVWVCKCGEELRGRPPNVSR